MEKVKGATGEEGKIQARRARKRPVVPPPESEIWPEQYRGKRWKSIFAILFAGRCQLCAYSFPPPKSRQLMDKWLGTARLLLCTNHPASPGELAEVLPTGTCREFRVKCWKQPRPAPAKNMPAPTTEESDAEVRRIPLGNGRFATVDAADYEELSKYKWYAVRKGVSVYAARRKGGRIVFMHREIMTPPKGYVVDHIDHNTLNNRRCNLRVCTNEQNSVGKKSRVGSSQFVGVQHRGRRWQAAVVCRGEFFYLGLFDDEIEAAKVRDRKAYELHGPYAHLNFPEDFQC
jgi:hypothetical protein